MKLVCLELIRKSTQRDSRVRLTRGRFPEDALDCGSELLEFLQTSCGSLEFLLLPDEEVFGAARHADGEMGLEKLHAQAEGVILRLKIKDEWLRARRSGRFVAALAASVIAGQATLENAVDHLKHLLFGGAASDLEKQGFREDAVLHAFLADMVRDIAQRKRFGHRRARASDLAGHIVVRVIELLREAIEAVGFFKRRQVLALDIFDQGELEGFGVIGDLFDTGELAESGGASGMIAALPGNDVVALLARDIAHQQRLEHALLFDRLGELMQIAERLAGLIRVGANLLRWNHPPDCGATVTGQRLDVMRVMPHLQRDGQAYSLGHVG